ncbi:PREDICTED: uncharacterized protein LOC106815104 [Priapulus caudatus]|uniref:Uncharacterized protein LOC106815104 n=1 Tax=Priapulus caudatus TaxID=37621 RepID=A0ABM1ES44_PRICU|nr:PREDICTED: uncharacterized protein LOC106815104 [Priapulus caudatus]
MMAFYEEPYDMCPRPQPLHRIAATPDPQLTLTPEKTQCGIGLISHAADRRAKEYTVNERKVVFDLGRNDNQSQSVNVKQFITNSNEFQPQLKCHSLKKSRRPVEGATRIAGRKNAICASASMTHGSKVKTKVVKGALETRSSSSLAMAPPGYYQTAAGTEEHALGRPEFHSTLRLIQELQQVREEEFDADEAVRRKLEESYETQQHLCEMVAKSVNVHGQLFEGLTTLDVSRDRLLAEEAQARLARVKPSKSFKPSTEREPEPDLMSFFSESLWKEYGSFHVDIPKNRPVSSRTAPLSSLSHVIEHRSNWEKCIRKS